MPSCSARSPRGSRASCLTLERPRVLELGCGTGLFSRHLVARYPDGSFVLTDACARHDRANAGGTSPARGRSHQLRGHGRERPGGQGPFDLIAMSMTLHWLADPTASLERLRRLLAPRGVLLYATLGPESFAEWRAVLARAGTAERARRHPGAAGRRRTRSVWCPMRRALAFFAA